MKKLVYLFLVTAFILSIQAIKDSAYCSAGPKQAANNGNLEGNKESCKTFIDLSKLIISLSTGVFVLLPAFLEKIRNRKLGGRKQLYAGLIFLLISIVFGLFVISGLAGTQRIGEYNIAASHIKLTSKAQWISFVLGLSLCGYFLITNLFGPVTVTEESNQTEENDHHDRSSKEDQVSGSQKEVE